MKKIQRLENQIYIQGKYKGLIGLEQVKETQKNQKDFELLVDSFRAQIQNMAVNHQHEIAKTKAKFELDFEGYKEEINQLTSENQGLKQLKTQNELKISQYIDRIRSLEGQNHEFRSQNDK